MCYTKQIILNYSQLLKLWQYYIEIDKSCLNVSAILFPMNKDNISIVNFHKWVSYYAGDVLIPPSRHPEAGQEKLIDCFACLIWEHNYKKNGYILRM